ncbi:hypothetical protein D3C75_1165690 [compost metagenome]
MVVRSLKGGCSFAAGLARFATGSRTAPGSLALADDSAQASRRYLSRVEVDVIVPLNGCFFESKDKLYILAGQGPRTHASWPAIRSLSAAVAAS